MKNERILGLLGYDRELLARLSVQERHSLRGSATAWLVACVLLGLAAAQAAWLILPMALAPIAAAVGVTLLTLNLVRVVVAGGGISAKGSLGDGRQACLRYRPSIIPALIFGVLAGILAQPAQVAFWPELDDQVEVHRQDLISQHAVIAEELGTQATYYRDQLESAGFPVFRMKRIWQEPDRALRLTGVLCVLVLLPGVWSGFISIRSRRSYEWQRFQRAHAAAQTLRARTSSELEALLRQWPSYDGGRHDRRA